MHLYPENKIGLEFTVPGRINGNNYNLDVLQLQPNNLADSEFQICYTKINMGILSMDEEGKWRWRDSNFTQIHADEIGRCIEAHFLKHQ